MSSRACPRRSTGRCSTSARQRTPTPPWRPRAPSRHASLRLSQVSVPVGLNLAGMTLPFRWPPFIGSRVADHTLPAMRTRRRRMVSRRHQFGGAALDEPSASGRGTGRVTLGSLLHGLRVELRALLEAYQLTPTWLWLAIGGASLGLACLGLLPIGAWSFVLQLVGFALLS